MPIANFGYTLTNVPAALHGHSNALRTLGLVIPVEVHVPAAIAAQLQQAQQPVPPPRTGTALVDTGASLTSVHEPELLALGLNTVGQAPFGTAGGVQIQQLYPATIRLPVQNWSFKLVTVAGCNLTGQIVPLIPPQPLLVLIGRDLLESMTLHWNGPGGICTLACQSADM
jgi:hypothetical protein